VQQGAQPGAGDVIADRCHERAVCIDGEDVLGHVCRAAESITTVTDPHHRHGGLGRDPLDIAAQVHIEHGIADHDDPAATRGREQCRKAVA
jgi:hypothetical protein